MTPRVSTSEPEFDPISDAIAKMDVTPLRDFIDAHVKRGYDDLTALLWESIETHLASDSATNITYRAAAVAERYIAEALAGDDKRLRDCLGLGAYAKPQPFSIRDGYYGSAGDLLRALVEKHADLLLTEVVAELRTEVRVLRDELARLNERRKQEGW